MIVHRLLDAFFRTLDAVDAVRDRVDRVLGREPAPDPWAVEWPPADVDGRAAPQKGEEAQGSEEAPANNGGAAKSSRKPAAAKSATTSATNGVSKEPPAKKPVKKPAVAKSTTKAAKADAAGKKSRKGSVDRSGKDFDSPRAKAIWEYVRDNRLGVVTEEAMLDGKKVLARVLWSLSAAEAAGSELGLTTADASALLHLAARMEVYATNIGRACRDHDELIEESDPDGRSKRYRLTAKGKALAVDIPTQKP